mmetsp:Transcript_68540/g.79865  ORF Transcript_68540/g.79865 Transcript_68540/m.79865 type:complete len:208 (+) Transcript_68540:134-757(+)
MSYLSRDNEKTLGELQRDLEATKQATREEKKSQLVLQLVIEKRKRLMRRLMQIFAHEATSDEQREEIMRLLEMRPKDVLLDPHISLRPLLLAMATQHFSVVRSINVANNHFMDDACAVLLGHLIGASPALDQLESVSVGGTAVRCRGITSILEGARMRRERLGCIAVAFALDAVNTDSEEESPEVRQEMKRRAQAISQTYPNISISW